MCQGFSHFSGFFASFCIGQIIHHQYNSSDYLKRPRLLFWAFSGTVKHSKVSTSLHPGNQWIGNTNYSRGILILEFWLLSLFVPHCCLVMTSQFYILGETAAPEKSPAFAHVTGNFLTCVGRDKDLGSGENRLVISGNALDHAAIRA